MLHDRLKEIIARAETATPGPWRASVVAAYVDADGQRSGKGGVYPGGEQGSPPLFLTTGWRANDAEFIAHARTDLPALLAAVEAVMELADRLEWEADPANHLGSDLDYCRIATAQRIRTAITDALEAEG